MKANLSVHLRRLADDIGPRPAGSAGNAAAARYIQEVFAGCGLDVEVQTFAVPAWTLHDTVLEVGGERLEAEANPYSPACDVTAPSVPIGTLEELEQADLDGRVAVLYGELARAPLPAKSWPFKGEREARAVDLLDSDSRPRPAAVLAVQTRPGRLERLVEDCEFTVPSATVPAEVGLRLAAGPLPRVRLRVAAEQHPGQSANVVGHLAGARPERLVLCAHYDTKVDTPGASDNGGGVAVLLALAQHLSGAGLACGLEFVAFTNEEYLPLGDDEYLRRGQSSLGQIVAALNFDGVGAALGANTVAAMACSPDFEALVRQARARCPGVLWVPPWPESNHSTFAWRGVASVAMTNTATPVHAHLRTDTTAWISAAKLEEAARLGADLARSLHDKPVAWTRVRGEG